jgi:tetratricopeptide (TPR) repeat protein
MTLIYRFFRHFLIAAVLVISQASFATAQDSESARIEEAKKLYAQAVPMDLTSSKRTDLLKQAEAILLKVIEDNPESMDAHRKLMGVYLLQQNYSRSIRIMQDAITLSPEDPKLFISLAFLYEHSGSLEFSEAMIDQALKLDAENKIAKDYKVVIQQKIQMRNNNPHQAEGGAGKPHSKMPADHGKATDDIKPATNTNTNSH